MNQVNLVYFHNIGFDWLIFDMKIIINNKLIKNYHLYLVVDILLNHIDSERLTL